MVGKAWIFSSAEVLGGKDEDVLQDGNLPGIEYRVNFGGIPGPPKVESEGLLGNMNRLYISLLVGGGYPQSNTIKTNYEYLKAPRFDI